MAEQISATVLKIGQHPLLLVPQDWSFPTQEIAITEVVDGDINSSILYLGVLYYASETASELIAAANAGGGTVSIPATTVLLSNDQIKALPTTPVEIIPAPGANKIIIPLSCVAILKVPGGVYYTNNTDAAWYLKLTQQVSNVAVVQQALGGAVATSQIVNFSFPLLSVGAGEFDGVVVSNYDATENENDLNVPLLLYGNYLGGSDYTGGNAANTLKMVIYYIIVDLG